MKALGGIEVDISGKINMKALREGDYDEFDLSTNINGGITVGVSADAMLTVNLNGSDGTIKDQATLDTIVLDGLPVNAGGCIPEGVCGKVSATFDGRANNGVTSEISYGLGVGEGIDFSVDVLEVSDYFFYSSVNDGTHGQVPFVNRDFYERSADKLIQNVKDLFKSE